MTNKIKVSKKTLFLKLAQPDDEGFSREVFVSEFTGEYEKLKFGNGGDWCRDDGSLKEYNIVRERKANAIFSVKLNGFRKNIINKQIKQSIKDVFKNSKCVVLQVSNIEIDHKDGRRDDPIALSPEKQRVEDFQPLSKCVNNAKRQHCKVCRETGIRFNAKNLGYKVSQVKGSEKYQGSCVGCYWFDPISFNAEISKDYNKIR